MSQIYKTSESNPPPGPILQLTPDSGAAVVPTAGNINVFGYEGTTVIDPNLITYNSGTSTLQLAHRYLGSATTVGATNQTLLTIPINVGSITTAIVLVSAIEPVAPNGLGGQVTGIVFRAGGGATLVATSDKLIGYSSSALSTATFNVTASGNNLIVTGSGVGGLTIEWNCIALITSTTAV